MDADHAAGNDERYWIQGQGFTSIFLYFYFPPSSYLRLLLLLSYLLYIEMWNAYILAFVIHFSYKMFVKKVPAP